MNRVDAIPAIALVMKAVLQRPLFFGFEVGKEGHEKSDTYPKNVAYTPILKPHTI